MGNPMNGEIYEGALRPGDVGLDADTARRLREMIPERRIEDLQRRFQEQGARATSSSEAAREMPRYKCHKEVWALKIAEIRGQSESIKPTIQELEEILARSGNEGVSIEPSGAVYAVSGAEIVPADEGYTPFLVSAEYMRKHKPQVGGYFIVYKDGYKSYSPAKAFDEGYTRVSS